MTRYTFGIHFLIALFGLSSGTLAWASDQQKAEKRMHYIAAMAADETARAIINQTMAEAVHARRIDLQRQRKAMNLNYGSLFLAHQLTDPALRMLDIAVQLEAGKTIVQIANEHNANWKLIADAATKLTESSAKIIASLEMPGGSAA